MSFFKDLKNKISKKAISDEQNVEFSDAIRKNSENGFLQGNFLISTTLIQESIFSHSVVFIANHDKSGAMGLLVNREIKKPSTKEVLKGLDIDVEPKQGLRLPLYNGGPVDMQRGFVIHSDDYKIKNTVTYPNGIAISSEKQAVQDYILGKGAHNMCIILGYAGWVAGQLEKEIESGAWISVPASGELIFNTHNDAKWQKAADSFGIDIFKLTPFIGNA